MQVTAIRDKWEGCPAPITALGVTGTEPRLSLGKKYAVYAMAVSGGVVLFQVLDDTDVIRWLPAWLFERHDASVPKDWVCNNFTEPPEVLLGPPFVAADQESYRRMAALEPAAVTAFRAQIPATNSPAPRNPRRELMLKFALLFISIFITAAGSELILRTFYRGQLAPSEDERSLMYHYDKELGWFPIANAKTVLFASRAFGATNNSKGFRDREHVPNNKPAIVFLGDSFVWGYDAEAAERFTDKLQLRHPEWEVYNFGVSGYGTDQEYILLHREFDAYHPRVVFLVYCEENDHMDNSSNVRYEGFYKPYCTIVGNRLQLQGIPVPRGERVFFAEHPGLGKSYLFRLLARGWFKITCPRELENPDPTGAIIRDLQRYVNSKGATFAMGLTQGNPKLEEFLRFFKIPYLDLSTTNRYRNFGLHWTSPGHTFVADKIEELLVKGKYMQDAQPQMNADTALR